MRPASPVATKELQTQEVVYAKDQPEYMRLPALRVGENGHVLARFHLAFWERLVILFRGNMYVEVLTFERPLQPLRLSVQMPLLSQRCEAEPEKDAT